LGQVQQRICFSGALRTTTLLPDIDGFNNLTNTGVEQLMRILVTGRRADARLALELFLRNRPDLDVVAEADDIQALLTQAEATQPDVILLDWDLCNRPLADLISALHLLFSQPGLVLINAPAESKQAALASGADACVVKGAPPKSLLLAIESVRLMREG
jgi:DNA-binding NarL/FixJ family response regulator